MNKRQKNGLIILLIIAILILIINMYGSRIIESKIKEALINQKNEFSVSTVQNVKFNLLKREIRVEGFKNIPTEGAIADLKKKDNTKKGLQEISISSFDIRGIGIYKLLLNNMIDVSKIDIKELTVLNYINPDTKITKDTIHKHTLDSITLGKIKGLRIREIEMERLQFKNIDIFSDKTLLQLSLQDIDLGGFELQNYQEDLYRINFIEKNLSVEKLKLIHFDDNYKLEIDKISKNHKDNIVDIEGLHFKPLIDKVKLGKSYKYNKVISDYDIEKIRLYNYQIRKTIDNNSVFMDSILITGMNADFYKDIRKPFNTRLRPKIPNVLLNEMKDTISIPKLMVQDSRIYFEMVLEKRDVHLKIDLPDINATIENIYSKQIHREDSFTINYKSKFMKGAYLDIKLDFPFQENKGIFYMKGNISKSKFSYFDSAIYPALGIKILRGDLDGMNFNVALGPRHASGTMTMLYHGLEAELFKKHSMDQNKLLSWSVNTTLHNSNPIKRKPTRVALISANRVLYKGFIHYMWVAAQSGIVNTLTPFGKTVDKAKAKALKAEAKKERKKKRTERKNNK